jgi:alkanesulfonate monooxygenase SsuD/methylene tetrahydromethanopterin reductase-like flavin-dependent oxidoreductase (luciferase family)
VDFGLAVMNYRDGPVAERLEASAEAVTRHGWRNAWLIDHLMVPASGEADYAWTLEPLVSMAWMAARSPALRIATGVLVPPMRDGVQLAKELATLDALSGGRLTVAVGVGDDRDAPEYANLGKQERFAVRGAYLDETIALWRHLWSGSREPFHGRFFDLEDYTFAPLPAQGASLPILSSGRSDRTMSRPGRITDGHYTSRWGPADIAARWPAVLAAAAARGRPRPYLASRVRVRLGEPPDASYSLCGTPSEMVDQLCAFEACGVDEFVAVLAVVDPDDIGAAADRFQREVVEPYRATTSSSRTR